MRSLQAKRGFTLIELLVVIAIIAILASILFPVFAKAREKARQTTCMSQVRQLATACQMYNQDNNGRYPNTNWSESLLNYLGGSNKMLTCPSDAVDTSNNPISYGYSGLMVGVDGNGVNESQINAPTEVGVICDASPSRPTAGLVGGGALGIEADIAMVPQARHSGGTVVGYADGHAKYIPGGVNDKDMSNGVTRAFYMASALGLINNAGGGLCDPNFPANYFSAAVPTSLTLGGDYAASPILLAAAEVWKNKVKASYYTKGFLGIGYTLGASNGQNFAWARADGDVNGKVGTATYAVAKDCMVFITAKNTKLPVGANPDMLGFINSVANGANSVTTAQVCYLFSQGYSANVFQAYTYDDKSGNKTFVKKDNVLGSVDWDGVNGSGVTFGSTCLTVKDDYEMVSKVANDPYGIGYCSSAIADPERVQILAVKIAGVISYFPNANDKYRWTMPANFNAWPFARTLYVDAGGAATGANSIGELMLTSTNPGPACTGFTGLLAGPLFKCSYLDPSL